MDTALRYGWIARLSAARPFETVEIIVADAGPRLDPIELDRLMRPFDRGAAGRSLDGGGRGPGVAVARTLAERNGGTIQVSPGAPTGLVVSLAFPIAV